MFKPLASKRINHRAVIQLLSNQSRNASNAKEIYYSDNGRRKLLAGVEKLFKAVATTLGPKGRNVVLQQSYGSPKITKDGVTVAKHIELEDNMENLGAQLIKDVASKANDAAGDGTTTATVLTYAIFSEGCKAAASGMNPMDLKRGIDLAVRRVIESLKQQTKEITSKEEITQVATISANGDRDIGELIANAMEKVGQEGVITVEDGHTLDNQLEIVEGMRFDRGYISPYFMTETKTQTCVLEKPVILVYDSKISSIVDIIKPLQYALNNKRPLLIIAEDVEAEALNTLILNRIKAGSQVCAVKAPGFGDHRKNNLQDISVLTGAILVSKDLGMKIENPEVEWYGSAEKVTVTKDETVIMNGSGTKEAIAERCDAIREQLQREDVSTFEAEKLRERLGKLSGGVAILKIGGSSDVEVGEKKDRVTDALNATKAAVAEGIVAGGGTALTFASKTLDSLIAELPNEDQKVGVKIVQNAIRMPLKMIAQNAGLEGAVISEHVMKFQDPAQGYDAATNKYVNMFESGIIDPTKVVKTALVDAASVASLMTTTEAMVVLAPKKEPEVPMGGMGGGMGGDYDY
ncbi:hypothetical protein C9374_007565 [Naegleria lovaniensis]|uniref:Uncharacterized protein n=1 Tax=Naegleria lovaniensis TaxID=51637 RepID=A0AA88KG62_NAELO|nr:uncharacterized protein C9374_007565 [Naegleria lovaniensis]KAG2378927.1 hypothetical protein C9374_007565 [Naegleria lovaniensis]